MSFSCRRTPDSSELRLDASRVGVVSAAGAVTAATTSTQSATIPVFHPPAMKQGSAGRVYATSTIWGDLGPRFELNVRARPDALDDEAPALGELVSHDHLQAPGHGDRRERAEDPRQFRADEHGDQHREWRQLHRPPVDDGLQEVILELLVEDEEDEHDDAGGERVQEGDRA